MSKNQPELGTKENPHPWPYVSVRVGEFIKVTTGLGLVEAVDEQGMTVMPEKGQRLWLKKR